MRFLALVPLLLSGPAAVAAEKAPIVLCQSGDFSGASSHFSRQAFLGSKTYFDEVNRKGGVFGRKIELLPMDDHYEPAQAVKNARECFRNKNLFALFDFFGSSSVAEVLPALKKERTPARALFLYGSLSGAELQRGPLFHELSVNMRPSYREETQLIVERFVARGKKKFGMFIQNDGFGKSGLDGVRSALKNQDLDVAAVAEYQRGQPVTDSFREQARKLKDSDVIVSIATYQAAAGLIRDLRDLGVTAPVVHVSFAGSSDTLDFLKKLSAQGKRDYASNVFITMAYPPLTQTEIPIVAEYLKASKEHPGKVPEGIAKIEPIRPTSMFGLEGYILAKTFVDLLRKSGASAKPGDFLKTLDNGYELNLGLPAPIVLDAKEHQGTHRVWLSEIVDGAFHLSER